MNKIEPLDDRNRILEYEKALKEIQDEQDFVRLLKILYLPPSHPPIDLDKMTRLDLAKELMFNDQFLDAFLGLSERWDTWKPAYECFDDLHKKYGRRKNPADYVEYWAEKNNDDYILMRNSDKSKPINFLREQYRNHKHLAIFLNGNKKPDGVVTIGDLIDVPSAKNNQPIESIPNLIKTDVQTCDEGTRMEEAKNTLKRNDREELIIINKNGEFLGVVTKFEFNDWENGKS